MKRFLSFLILFLGFEAYANFPTQYLQLNLNAVVPPICRFTINGVMSNASQVSPPSTQVNLSMSASQEQASAVVITCNNSAGYSLRATSLNNSKLMSVGGSEVNYQLDVNTSSPQTLNNTTPTTVWSRNSLTSPEVAVSYPIRVTYPGGVPSVLSGTYSDVVTFTLLGN